MYLKKLEIQGFKSFANKTLLEYEPGITSVVGPNGSGKSNIADSLRWVFGEQSMKLLRSKKSEDVIFAGSDQKSRLGACEVMVYFDNKDHKMPIAYEEVVIGRRLFRNGNSEYLINNTQVRLLDIQELLLKSGFGNTSYCVVGQGMIDGFVLDGPQAIKEMIEEAAGIKPYYFKRDRTLRRLERTESNLLQVKALVSEIEPRLRSLRRQAKKLERRAEVEEELKATQILYFGQMLKTLNFQIAEIKTKESVFDKQIVALNAEMAELSKNIEAEEHHFQGVADYKKMQSELSELYREKQKLALEQLRVSSELQVMTHQGSSSPKLNWVVFKGEFRAAFEKLKFVVKNFINFKNDFESLKKQIEETESLFKTIWQEIESDVSKDEADKEKTARQKLEILKKEIDAVGIKISQTEKKQQDSLEAQEQRKNQLFVKDRLLRNKQETLVRTRDAKNQFAVEIAKFEARREAGLGEAKNELGSKFESLLATFKNQNMALGISEKISSLKKQLMDIGGVDDLLQKEYEETEARYQYLTTQSADLEKAIADLKTVIGELDEIIKKQFNESFTKISEKFSEYFRLLFNGGKATMSLIRERPITPSVSFPLEGEDKNNDDFPSLEGEGKGGVRSEIVGVEIKATPPGKRLGGISALSGGERALTSIALLCSLLAAYPSPFVVLDEVDAALDEANSIRFGKILGTLAHRTQFITITHNRETMRQSHTLYGITMREDGVSKILSLKLQEAAVYSTKN